MNTEPTWYRFAVRLLPAFDSKLDESWLDETFVELGIESSATACEARHASLTRTKTIYPFVNPAE